MKKNKKQAGFALIEVMLAALVMMVGSLGFLKLQQMGLQSNFNNFARIQGTTLAEGFVEQLRGNVGFLKSARISGVKIQGHITSSSGVALKGTADCSSSINTSQCANNIMAFHQFTLSQQMNSVASNSSLCYLEQAAGSGRFRITYLWQDNTDVGKNASLECPTFNDNKLDLNNSVTIYAQL